MGEILKIIAILRSVPNRLSTLELICMEAIDMMTNCEDNNRLMNSIKLLATIRAFVSLLFDKFQVKMKCKRVLSGLLVFCFVAAVIGSVRCRSFVLQKYSLKLSLSESVRQKDSDELHERSERGEYRSCQGDSER
jgi:hypothetical protein